MKGKYLISEYWDGGRAEYADTLKEATEKARKMRDGIRWTAAELRHHKRRCENFIIIERELYDGEGNYIDSDIAVTLIVNEKTLHRIY